MTAIRCPHCGGRVNAEIVGPKPLTKRQYVIYEYLVAYIAHCGYAPSLDEICEHFGYASYATAHEHLTTLESKGYIAREFNLSRSIRCLVTLGNADDSATPGNNPGGTQTPEDFAAQRAAS